MALGQGGVSKKNLIGSRRGQPEPHRRG
jgi:hypothetical protein